MRAFLMRSVAAVGVLGLLAAMLSCGHDQQLVAVTIQPGTETFGSSSTPLSADAGATAQLYAYGHYIHPPVTKNITTQVTWASNTPAIATVAAGGALTATGNGCGNSLISATVQTNSSSGGISSSGAVVVGFATAEVVCPGTNPILTVQISGTGSISSTPSGLSCASTCSNSFSPGTPITINAAPSAPATSASFAGCDSGNGTAVCSINSLTVNRTVSVTFQ